MNSSLITTITLYASCLLSSSFSSAALPEPENETRQIRFAERVIFIELTRALSPSVRQAREKCSNACSETGALELGVGLIGVSQSDKASEALINLLGLRLDAGGAEELICQILSNGKTLSYRIKELRPELISQHCSTSFNELRKREIADISDVTLEKICKSNEEILSAKEEILRAINSGIACELQ
ncbi:MULTISPECIES: Imm57 family immunity protein [unclassified Pseudomonas]|uniref:Imm57 family immunity protein n=1 Tax=unclassified Pseudomonas TaxID=196821 RepID=UPI001111ED36